MALADHDKAFAIAETMTDGELIDLVDSLLALSWMRRWVLVRDPETGDRWERRKPTQTA